jgi:hypothetical protein
MHVPQMQEAEEQGSSLFLTCVHLLKLCPLLQILVVYAAHLQNQINLCSILANALERFVTFIRTGTIIDWSAAVTEISLSLSA